MFPAMKFADWFAKSGKSQAQVARDAGVTPQCINQILLGLSRPSLTVAFAIEKATGGKVRAVEWVNGK